MVEKKMDSPSRSHKVGGRRKETWYVLECPACGSRSYVASPRIEGWCNKNFSCRGNKMILLGEESKRGIKKIVKS